MSLYNSVYSGRKGPSYPSGDPVEYPQQNIPIGTMKLYTEQYISDIGQAIQDITMSEDTYTTQEMSYAILHYIPINSIRPVDFNITFSTYITV